MQFRLLILFLLLPTVSVAATATLLWSDPNNAPGTVTEYRIERSADRQATWAPLGTVPAGTLTYQDATATTAHCYRVRAANANTVSEPSNVACVPPAAPMGVSVTITFSGVAN